MYMIKKKAPLTPEKADIIASTYQDPALGFQSAQALFKTLKPSNPISLWIILKNGLIIRRRTR